MELVETTITEHIFNQGKVEGKAEGQIELLEMLYQQGILSKELMEKILAPLKQKLNELTGSH